MNRDNEQFANMTYIERLDVEQRMHDQEMEKLRYRQEAEAADRDRRVMVARQEKWQGIGVAFAVALAVVGVFTGIVYWNTRPPTPESYRTSDEYRETQCVKNHGVWVDESMLSRGGSLCLYPGVPVEKQIKE